MSNREITSPCERCTGLTDDAQVEGREGRPGHTGAQGPEDLHSYARVLLPHLRAERFSEARHAHIRGYRAYLREYRSTRNPHPPVLAQHLLFCALTGNVTRGVSLLEAHFSDLVSEFSAIGVLLGRAVDAGFGDEPLRVPVDIAFSLNLTGAATIASVSRALGETRDELRTVHYDIALSVLPRPRPPVTHLDFGMPGTAEGWLERCDDLAELHEYESAYRAVGNALALDPAPELRAEALGYRVRLLSELERREEIPPLIAERAALLRDLGENDHAGWLERSAELAVQPLTGNEVALAEVLVAEYDRPDVPLRIRAMPRLLLGHVLLYALRAEEAVSELRTGVEHARAGGAHRMADSAVYALAHALTMTGEYDAAEQALRVTLSRPGLRTALRPRLQLLLAQVLAASGKLQAAAGLAAEATEHFTRMPGSANWVGHASMLEATYLAEMGDVVGAAERLKWTVERGQCAEWHPTARWSLHCKLGSLLVSAHRTDEAIDVLRVVTEEIAAAVGFTEDEEISVAEVGSEAWYWMGVALRQRGDRNGALKCWDEALDVLAASPDAHAEAARIHFTIAELWHSDENFDTAIAAYLDSLDHIEQTNDPLAVAQVRRSLGLARCENGDVSGLEDLAVARQEAEQMDEDLLMAELADVTARSFAVLQRYPEAVAAALQAADAYRQAGDFIRAAMAELMAGRIVARQGHVDEAVMLLRSAIEATIEAGAGMHAVDSYLLLADLLDGRGEHEEARSMRREAERRAI